MIEVATRYLQSGLCVLPAILNEKRPALTGWKTYQSHLPNPENIPRWFGNGADALCLVAGTVSGNLELLDFDNGGELYSAWEDLIPGELFERLVIERSRSGGRHVIYRCESAVGGNMKLAQGKRDGHLVTLIETRGEGGLFLCAPTAGYVLKQGMLEQIPVLSCHDREILLEAAWSLNEHIPPVIDLSPALPPSELRPGDDFNERGELRDTLVRHGWLLTKPGDNEYWRRPGKSAGWSATLKDRVFYVFSANADPFESDRAYSPFSVYALLEHSGDFAAAASALRLLGYGECEVAVDLSRLSCTGHATPMADSPQHPDPGPLPLDMLRVPGFISEVMDHCLETAPYPNVALAFCGAVALQAVLAGRKVRDTADNRTNLYLLALAFSSVGKDWPRKVNTHVIHKAGMVSVLGEKFASGEGIQDSLHRTPSMIFQTDEIDGLLQSINKSRDARYENLMGTLLTMYSAANSIYPMRRKAGKEEPGVIDQPCLVVYGTAIPTHYYEALSERMLTNGFFARMMIVESGPRNPGQEPGIIDPPPRVMEAARWWSDFCPGSGNLEAFHPHPRIVEADDAARDLLTEGRKECEAEYATAESRGDPVGTTVWGRVPEQIRKLSLIYSVSVDHQSPRIDRVAVQWATDFMMHQTRRMLFMANNHVAENPFHGECLKLLRKLGDAPNRELAHSVLLKRMKTDAKTFQELITTLEQQGDLVTITQATAGRPQRHYRLPGEVVG